MEVVQVLAQLRADASGMVAGFRTAKMAQDEFAAGAGKVNAANLSMGDSMDKVGKMSHTMSTAVGAALGGIAVAAAYKGLGAIKEFVGGSVSAASNLNETMSKVNVLFEDQTDVINKWADNSAVAMGQSKTQALDAAANFAIFGKSAGLTGSNLTDFATKLTATAGDMASFSNTTPQEAIVAIGSALRGESEPIRRYGVLLNEAGNQAEAFKMGIISSTKDALTPQQRVLAVQSQIMRQLGEEGSKTLGDFARTTDGLANQQRILAAQLENTKMKFGEALLPAATAVTGFFNTKLIPVMERLASWAKDNLVPALQSVGEFLRQLGDPTTSIGAKVAVVTAFFQNFFEKIQLIIGNLSVLKPILSTVAGILGGVLYVSFRVLSSILMVLVDLFAYITAKVKEHQTAVLILVGALTAGYAAFKLMMIIQTLVTFFTSLNVISKIFTATQMVLNAVLSANPIGLVVIAIAALVGALVIAWKNSEKFREVIVKSFNAASEFVGKAVNYIIDYINMYIKAWNKLPFGEDVALIAQVTLPKLDTALIKSAKVVSATTGKMSQDLGNVGEGAIAARKEIERLTSDVVMPAASTGGGGGSSSKASAAARELAQAAELAKAKMAQLNDELKINNDILAKAKDAYDSYKKGITSVITGVIDFGKAATAETGSFLKNLVAQASKAQDFGSKVKQLLALGLSESAIAQVLQAGADAGIKIADEIILGGATIVDQINTLISATASVAEGVGVSAADQFYAAGVTAGQALVDAIRSTIIAAGFTFDANGNIVNPLEGLSSAQTASSSASSATATSTAVQTVKKKASGSIYTQQGLANKLAKIPMMAAGGIVNRPTLAMIGEKGPEAVIPLPRGNSGGQRGGGNTFNITVNAGMGTSGSQVGKEIVEAIKRFEKTSGSVFMSA